MLIEVGVTSPNFLKRREIQKILKYSHFTRSILEEIGVKTAVLSLVYSWDVLVSYNFKKNLVELGLEKNMGNIQKSILKNTFEACKVMLDRTLV